MAAARSCACWLLCVLCAPRLLVHGAESSCCARASGSCRSACAEMSLVEAAADATTREESVRRIQDFCPSQLESFWECLNKTLDDMRAGDGWSGRACCSLPQLRACQLACVTAASRRQLAHSCRRSDELAFFSCLGRQQLGDDCCRRATSGDCAQACRAVFRSRHTPSAQLRATVTDSCGPRVLQCVANFTHLTTADNPLAYLHCCELAERKECRSVCRAVLRTKTTNQEIVDSLVEECGDPLPHDRLWQCFLSNPAPVEASRIDRLGMDSAKMHCCGKAVDQDCRRLCVRSFSNEWSHLWDDFSSRCLSPARISEDALRHCIDEVDEPCELGCDGLSYCTNFNNRPTELFRSCGQAADEAARLDVALWRQEGRLQLPQLQLPLLNISACSPGLWKAVACALQLKPCDRYTHVDRVCRSDCLELLGRCVDWGRLHATNHTTRSLCALLSYEDPSIPCISLARFLQPSGAAREAPRDSVTSPCRPSPCNSSQVCLVNHDCSPGRRCAPYSCKPGCKLGEVSQYMVPAGTLVLVPLSRSGLLRSCHSVCQCSASGAIEHCEPLPCIQMDSCLYGIYKIKHGVTYPTDCKDVSCYAGELTFSKKKCRSSSSEGVDRDFTSLPCNCPPSYEPVCGRNGVTYPNPCLARCNGLADSDFRFQPCSSTNPCDLKPCGEGQTCYVARKACLSLQQGVPCKQYMCVDNAVACPEVPYSPVCDTEGQEHPNICYLRQYGRALAYTGRCLTNCAREGPVCGVDGETYGSQCAAHAARVSVDYAGECRAVGLVSEEARPQCGAAVSCPAPAPPGCPGVTPPGACCPQCGGAVRLLYSRRQVDRLPRRAEAALSVSAVLAALERHVQVAECAVRGHLTLEAELLLLVQAVPARPSALQLEACVGEADKLAHLVREASPRLRSDLGLSVLTSARVCTAASGARRALLPPAVLLMLLLAARL
ncbi:reversion-inducing cysteine-rich protein with Kazal motifs isoform X2 [Bacillus rossius redtenbacheri]|uniref:reversion-inducing cysteine-rich protein with Kazal motifs isoform X2 n=1 Tax=Bacillus rossius redtenbacheri TaxID=93214 RepID=UPI002FDED745